MHALWPSRTSSRTLAIGFAIAVAVWLAVVAPGVTRAALLSQTALALFAAFAVAATVYAARRARPDERAGWTLVAAGAIAWLSGQLFWYLYAFLGVAVIVPAPSDVCYLAAAPLFITGFVAFLVRAGQRLAVYALALDVGAVMLTLLAVVALYVSGLFSAAATRLGYETTVAVLYPVLYVAATGAALSTVWGMPAARPRAAFVHLAVAMSTRTLVFTLWLPLYVDGGFAFGSALDLVLLASDLVLGVAALRAIEDRQEETTSELSRETIHLSRLFLPAGVALASAYVLVASQLDRTTATDTVIALCVAATVVVLALRAGLALFANYRLGVRERRRATQYEALYAVGLETANERSLDELVRLIVDRATDLTRTDGSVIALVEQARGFIVRAVRRPHPALQNVVGQPLVGIGRAAVEARSLIALPDYAMHPDSNPALRGVIASAMAAPLIVRGDVIGVITVYSMQRRTFGEATQRLFRLYAAQAATALVTTRLLEESRVLARHDALTGALNRRSLVERLETEIAEARRHGDAFCVVMCDLDGLKAINDTAGHLVGDEVLRRVADGIRTSARTEDSVARFGGDEFVLLLPRTSRLQGQALVSRITGRLRELTYTWGGREQPLPRVSIGVAAFPDDGLTTEQLIAAADARMYADKSRHRSIEISLGS